MSGAARSRKPLESSDLKLLADIAKQDRKDLFLRKPRLAVLKDHIVAVALCQGGALHFVDGKNGIKDLDVWTFYREHPKIAYPHRRRKERDFGSPRFGKAPGAPETYIGRKVDCLGRSIEVQPGEGPGKAIQRYLKEGKSVTARALALKAVVLIEPKRLLGKVIWPLP